MGAGIGFVAGLGLLLIFQALVSPSPGLRQGRTRVDSPRWRGPAMGVPGVTNLGVSLASAAAFVLATTVVAAVSGVLPVGLAFGAGAAYLPVAFVRSRARRRRRELAEVWPEAVDHLASAVRAGLSLPEALAQLGERGPEPLRPAFDAFARDYMVTGRFGDCLDRLKDTLADPAADRVVEALRIARDVGGGDLGRMLRTLSRFLREDARTRAELESRQAWVVNGARLAAAAPWAVLLVLSFQPEVIARYQSPAGTAVIVVGAAVCLVAYRLMVRLGRLPDEPRVLA